MAEQLKDLFTCTAYDSSDRMLYQTEIWAMSESDALLEFDKIIKVAFPDTKKVNILKQPSIFSIHK